MADIALTPGAESWLKEHLSRLEAKIRQDAEGISRAADRGGTVEPLDVAEAAKRHTVVPEQEVSLNEPEKTEVKTLKVLAGFVVFWLVVSALGSLAGIVAVLGGWLSVATSVKDLLLCTIAATGGSSISALVSAADRISNGWELSSSKKYPRPEPKDKFVARMAPFFAVRPFLGSVVGFLAYVGIVGGYLIAAKNGERKDFSQEALLFLTFLAGLFAKTFLEKLRAMFDTLFGKK